MGLAVDRMVRLTVASEHVDGECPVGNTTAPRLWPRGSFQTALWCCMSLQTLSFPLFSTAIHFDDRNGFLGAVTQIPSASSATISCETLKRLGIFSALLCPVCTMVDERKLPVRRLRFAACTFDAKQSGEPTTAELCPPTISFRQLHSSFTMSLGTGIVLDHLLRNRMDHDIA